MAIPNKVIEIRTLGPQGPIGPQGPSGSGNAFVNAIGNGNFIRFTTQNNSVVPILFNNFLGTAQTSSMLAPYVLNSQTSSFLVTASVALNTITFTKGDGSFFPITIDTGSGGNVGNLQQVTQNGASTNIPITASIVSASSGITGSLFGTASWATNSISSSLASRNLLTASVNLNTITFRKGDNTDFTITVDTGSGEGTAGVSSLEGLTGTIGLIAGSGISITTSSNNITITNTGGSGNIGPEITGSLIKTASALANTITFTKGDGSEFTTTITYVGLAGNADNIDIDNVSNNTRYGLVLRDGNSGTYQKLYADTEEDTPSWNPSTNTFISPIISASSFTGSLSGTSSWAINSQTASFLPIGTYSITASWAQSASNATNAQTSSFLPVGTYSITSSWATNALTSSYVLNAVSSSFTTTASYASNGGVTRILAGPNITLSPTNGLGQVTITSTGGGGGSFNTATGSYGSFYDTTTQTNPVANVPRSMSFNSTDISNGVSISGSTNPFNTYIKVANAGVYDIQFSAQLDKTDSGTDNVIIWIRKNGIDLAETATDVTLQGNNEKAVAAWNWFVNAAAGDYFQLMWFSDDTNVRLYSQTATANHPGIPSVILTVNRVDQFLSNTGSFSGSFTGNLIGTASTASFYQETDPVFVAKSASLATTGSNNFNGNQTITGSLIQGLEGNIATGEYSHAEGQQTQAYGDHSHTEGRNTIASGSYSHAEGQDTIASGSYSHAEGSSVRAIGEWSHAEGDFTQAKGDYSHAEGNRTIASGSHSHAEGYLTIASGDYSHAEGNNTKAIGTYSHAKGQSTQATGNFSHAEGDSTIAQGNGSHAEGLLTTALGLNSHAEGLLTTASANYSHAEGQQTQAIGEASHAEGLGTIASGSYQHVQGQWNATSSVQSAFIVGNGTDNSNRSNLIYAHNSTVEITGSLEVNGGITGSLFGTSSWATNALTTSFAPNYVLNSQTSSFVQNSQTSSFVQNSQTSSFVQNSQTSSFVQNSQTSSFITSLQTGSMAVSTSVFSTTASYALNTPPSPPQPILFYFSASEASGDVPLSGQVIQINTIPDRLRFNTKSHNDVDLVPVDFSSFYFNQIGSLITLRATNSGAFRIYQVIDYTFSGDYIEYTTQLNANIISGSLNNGDIVEFRWDKSADVGQITSGNFIDVTNTYNNNSVNLFFNTSPAIIPGSSEISTLSYTGSGYIAGAIPKSANLTVNSLTSSLLGTSSWATNALTASFTPNAITTASVNLNTITFTKGSGATFNITVDTGSGGGGVTVTNGEENQYVIVTTGDPNIINGEPGLTYKNNLLIVSNTIRTSYVELTSSLAKGSSEGFIIKYGNTSTEAGFLYYLSGSNWLTSSLTLASSSLLAIAITTNSSGGMLLQGTSNHPSIQNLTPGQVLYLSGSGVITPNVPTISGQQVRVVGYGLSGSNYVFNPSTEYVTLA